MNKPIFCYCVLVVLVASLFCGVTAAVVPVGVKVGDWIEYTVLTTGSPPEMHNVKWARMDIVSIEGSTVEVNVTTQNNEGALSSLIMALNLEKGEIGAWFIIPANLTVGDQFYDINLARNISIEGQEQKTYAGTVREIINASIPERVKDWDKATGVFLKSIDTLPEYTINATATKTNMWTRAQSAEETDLYIIWPIAVLIGVAVVVGFWLLRRR